MEYIISSYKYNMKNIPYTYLIGWSSLDTWYYGRRTAKDCDPKEFWKTYFTSSDYVMEFRSKHGDPDIIKIHKTFDDEDYYLRIFKCVAQEKRFLRRMNVVTSDRWLNADYGDRDTSGLVNAKNPITGERLMIKIGDLRLVSGELVGVNSGITISKTACLHCGKIIGKNNIKVHERSCHSNPNRVPGVLSGTKISEEGRQNMKTNHADVSGGNNPRSVWWRLTSPENQSIEFCGCLDKTVKELGLGVLLLRKYLGNTVPNDIPGRHPISKKTIGWRLEKMNTD